MLREFRRTEKSQRDRLSVNQQTQTRFQLRNRSLLEAINQPVGLIRLSWVSRCRRFCVSRGIACFCRAAGGRWDTRHRETFRNRFGLRGPCQPFSQQAGRIDRQTELAPDHNPLGKNGQLQTGVQGNGATCTGCPLLFIHSSLSRCLAFHLRYRLSRCQGKLGWDQDAAKQKRRDPHLDRNRFKPPEHPGKSSQNSRG